MTDKQQIIYFNELSKSRKEGAKALESFALRGVKNSVVEKYSDQAHFIYELLQNADDAEAKSARFVLLRDRLIFAHNGTRRFSVSDPATEEWDLKNGKLGDINAISAVGSSNKTDTASIGKFGVGFKAVFQYTATPHIYDPNIYFKMEKFIVPILLDKDYPGRRTEETLFVFPFDHEKRSAEDAYADISEKLLSLDYPLLFLTHLKHISFEIAGDVGSYEKSVEETRWYGDTTAEFIRMTKNVGKNSDCLYNDTLWLFSRNSKVGYPYAVGYFTNEKGKLIPKKHNAFCFFPTKEATGLNFIFHAPFLLTDSRETIRAGERHNLDMISLLAKLSADSLEYLLDIGEAKGAPLITDDIFDIVPFDESLFEEVDSRKAISFKPIYMAMKESFQTKAIIPARDGYTVSEHAYWASVPQLARLFSNDQLAVLTKDPEAKWAFPSFGRDETNRQKKPLADYIDSITESRLDENDILKGKSRRVYIGLKERRQICLGVTASFIEAQPVKWLHQFYKWIDDVSGRRDGILTKPIFLDQNRKAAAAFDEKKQAILFLPTEEESGYDIVNKDLIKNKDTLAFLKRIGVREPSLRDEIYNKILPQYKDGTKIKTLRHFQKFFRYYRECPQSEVKTYIGLIRECKFVLYRSADDEKRYRGRADELYFPTERLHRWFAEKTDTRFVCYDEYTKRVEGKEQEDLYSFLTDLGVKDIPRILSYELSEEEAYEIKENWAYSTRYQKWMENRLDGCKEIVEAVIAEQSAEKSRMIWEELLTLAELGSLNKIFYGTYGYFYYSDWTEKFDSTEAKRLRTKPWLLNDKGEFVSAEELTVQTLHPQYDRSKDEAVELLNILGIGELSEDEEDLTSYAEALGLSEEETRRALREFASRKMTADSDGEDEEREEEEDTDEEKRANPRCASVRRVAKELSRRADSSQRDRSAWERAAHDTPADEDEYTKTVDVEQKIEAIKERAENEIQEIARLEDLKQQAREAERYSYGWFKTLLELETLVSSGDTSDSREISISFSKVEREEGTLRTLILKHPNRYIPQSMEELADIPLELRFANRPAVRISVEVLNVRSYILRAKLRTHAEIDGIDLSLVTEARIDARNPVFLMEELKRAFLQLGEQNGYEDDFSMKDNLCKNIEFVFGPPGTGKTTYLAKDILLPIMRSPQNYKVLVLTPTNKSADVLTRRLMEIMGSDQSYRDWLVRFGSVSDSVIEESGVFRDKTFDIRTFPKNVTVTTLVRFPYDYFLPDKTTRLHLNALEWDYIIMDEASMIPLVNMIYPLYKKTPQKFIIAGDPFQIEPITAIDLWKDENIYRMVELDSFVAPTTRPYNYHVKLLTTQYRSIPEIGEVFSRFAYGGVLKHFRKKGSRRPLPLGGHIKVEPLNIIKFPVSRYESIYRPKRLQKKTPYQVYSALFSFEFIKYLAALIAQNSGDKYRIGLIAPYRAQADLIDKLMASAVLPENVDVQIGTIHGFQGDECDIIIALFNPPPSITANKNMFLNKLNIVNVSISRARDYLFLIMPDDKTENVEHLTLIKEVERLCKEQSGWIEQTSAAVEHTIFGSETYIEEHSFATSHQLVNVYGRPEKQYEVRSEESAVDVQIHDVGE